VDDWKPYTKSLKTTEAVLAFKSMCI